MVSEIYPQSALLYLIIIYSFLIYIRFILNLKFFIFYIYLYLDLYLLNVILILKEILNTCNAHLCVSKMTTKFVIVIRYLYVRSFILSQFLNTQEIS